MKVIFLTNHEDYKIGDIKEIADGYARNFLMPKGIVKLATDSEVKNLEGQIKKLQAEEEKKVAETTKTAEKLAKEKIVIAEQVNEEGHLYGAVTPKEIAEKLADMGYEVDGSDIVMEASIHDLGEYSVTVRLGHGVETEIKVTINRA